MPGLSLNLSLTNLQKKNYNSLALGVWDFPNASATLTSFGVEVDKGRVTIQWGDNTQNNSISTTLTANHTY